MKILILVAGLDTGATGIVTKNLIDGLVLSGATIHVLNEYSSRSKDSLKDFTVFDVSYNKIKQSPFFTELCMLLFKYPLNEINYIRKVTKKAISLHKEYCYDVVMVLSSAHGFHLLQTGVNIKKKTKLPLYIHATDPIPAPKPWYNTQSLRRAYITIAKKLFKKADIISLSNTYMLEYQLRIMNIKNIPSFVIHNPSTNNTITQKIQNDEPKIFLYVGSIYHQRQPDELLKAFEIFSKDKKVELWFLGNNKKLNLDKFNFSEYVLNKIRLLDFQSDPSKVIEQASVLIDFDANFKNDVFISSKLITYLSTNIPILCLTPKNSPSDNLLKNNVGLGVVKMYYDEENSQEAFQKALNIMSPLSRSIENNRKNLLEVFKNDKVGGLIVSALKEILLNKSSVKGDN
jgi:glycosyltransferase involved in cell wall biosynthesis